MCVQGLMLAVLVVNCSVSVCSAGGVCLCPVCILLLFGVQSFVLLV